MLKTQLPSPARRALGSGLFAIASVVVAFAAWAAEPTPAPAPSITDAPMAPAPGSMRKLATRMGFLKLPPDAQIQMSASSVSQGPNGEMILEGAGGDVEVRLLTPAGRRHTVKMIKTPDGETTKQDVVEENAAPQQTTVRARKVTFIRAQDGSTTLQFDDGSIETN